MNRSGGAAVHGDLTGAAFDPAVRHLLYEPVCDAKCPLEIVVFFNS
jgi:hypothetical protein